MAKLLRRVWKSVTICPSSSQSNADLDCGSVDPAVKLPQDVFLLILKRLGPRNSARAALVCRAWRSMVADERLWHLFLREEAGEMWEAVLFAETYLRSGFPVRSVVTDVYGALPFRLIFSQRKQLQGSVIIDGGSGYCKYGQSKCSGPCGRLSTFLEYGNIESPMYSRLRHFFLAIYNSLQLKPSTQPIIVSTPICHCDDTEPASAARLQLREAIYTVLFDMNVPAVCAIDQSVLALYAARKTSGIVVNIGFQVTSVVPILCGKVMHNVGVEIMGQGALRLTSYLSELMHERGIGFSSMNTVRTLKEKLCYVAEDYHAELTKDVKASFRVEPEGVFTLSQERFQTGEILFQPQLGGIRTMGLHRAVELCIEHCNTYEVGKVADEGWFRTIVLAGGSACLPGLAGRLEKELHQALPSTVAKGLKVLSPPYGSESAWFGAKIISNMSTYPQVWCIRKKQFRRYGVSAIHSMTLDDN